MGSSSSPEGRKARAGAPSSRSANLWFLVILLVAGSFVMTLVQLSKGLHEQLLASKQSLHSLRAQLIQVGEQKAVLEHQQGDDQMKASRLRDKSKTVLEELLNQQKMVKALQFELIAAREDLNSMILNCTGSSRKMRKQFNITMRALKDKVTSNREYRILLKKLIKEKAMVENTLEMVQYQAYNVSKQSEAVKEKLRASADSMKRQVSLAPWHMATCQGFANTVVLSVEARHRAAGKGGRARQSCHRRLDQEAGSRAQEGDQLKRETQKVCGQVWNHELASIHPIPGPTREFEGGPSHFCSANTTPLVLTPSHTV